MQVTYNIFKCHDSGSTYGCICGGLGSFLADLYLGFPTFMFATLIIKGIMGYIAGKFLYTPQGQPSGMRKF